MSSLANILGSDAAWSDTVDQLSNTSFTCLRNHTDCSAVLNNDNELNYIMDGLGSTYYEWNSNNTGFDLSGEPCTNFGLDAAASHNCSIRPEITWEPQCPTAGGPCIDPENIKVKITLVFSSSRLKTLNLNSFSRTILRPNTYFP